MYCSFLNGLVMDVNVNTAERRRSVRMPQVFQVSLCDNRWRSIARGRTVNISEGGVLIVTEDRQGIPKQGQLHLEILLPTGVGRGGNKRSLRIVRYICRIARVEKMGHLLTLGLEFIEKIH